MELKDIQKTVNNKLGVQVEFDADEAAFLIEFAINHLLALGSTQVDYFDEKDSATVQ